MKPAQPIPQEVTQQVAEYFSILSEPMRLRLLNLLRDQERCVQELVESTETSQANVSKHLKVMLQAGILSRRSEGTSAYYRVEDELIFELCNLVCDRLAARIEQQARHFRAFGLSQRQQPVLNHDRVTGSAAMEVLETHHLDSDSGMATP
jgi:DNA-binding transcriptional ArsR family regulator